MRWWSLLWVAVVLCGSAIGVRAEDSGLPASKPEVRKEIVATIDGQLAAFRRHDLRKAYAYSAAALRAQKPFPLFAAIVRTQYPELWSNTRAEYGIVHDDGSAATVIVHVYAPSGNASYDYTLVKEVAGWRVHDILRHDPNPADKV